MDTGPSVKEFLEGLRAEGTGDSAGAFTLDPQMAWDKFRLFTLDPPHEYVAVLISALISGGASELSIEADSDDFIVCSDFIAPRDHLELLFSLAASSEAEPHLFRLAISLQTALALSPSKVEMVSWDGSQAYRAALTTSGMELESLEGCPWESQQVASRVHVREKPSLRTAGKFLSKVMKGGQTPEQICVRTRCSSSPVPIHLNGELVNRRPALEHCFAYIKISSLAEAPTFHPQLEERPTVVIEEEGLQAYVGLSHYPDISARAKVIVGGLTYQGWPLRYASEMVVYAEGLQTDLSFFHLVEDEGYRGLRERLDWQVREGVARLFETQLLEEPLFSVVGGHSSFAELRIIYEKFGVLVVEPGYDGPDLIEVPVVTDSHPVLALLFPNQISRQEAVNRLPFGDYLFRKQFPDGAEIGLLKQAELRPVDWTDERKTAAEMLATFRKIPLPGRLRHGKVGPKLPEMLEFLRLAYEAGHFDRELTFDTLCYLHICSRSRSLVSLLEQTIGDETRRVFARELAETISLATWGGSSVGLLTLLKEQHPGACYRRYTDYPIRLEPPPDDAVVVPDGEFVNLQLLNGPPRLKRPKGSRHGLIDPIGSWVCEPEGILRSGTVHSDRIAYKRGKQWGYTDGNGIPVIPARFEYAGDFEEGLAVVQNAGKQQLINREGEPVGEPRDSIFFVREGLRLSKEGERWGFLDQKGEVAIPFQYEKVGHFGEGRALVDLSYFIDQAGNRLQDFRIQAEAAGPFVDGMASVKCEGAWGLLNTEQEWLIEPVYEQLWAPTQGVVPAKQPGGLWGLLDSHGKVIADFQFEYINPDFGEGLFPVQMEREAGFLNLRGEVVLRGYTRTGGFFQGLARAVPSDCQFEWGYINTQGDFVIEARFLHAGDFSENRATVSPIQT